MARLSNWIPAKKQPSWKKRQSIYMPNISMTGFVFPSLAPIIQSTSNRNCKTQTWRPSLLDCFCWETLLTQEQHAELERIQLKKSLRRFLCPRKPKTRTRYNPTCTTYVLLWTEWVRGTWYMRYMTNGNSLYGLHMWTVWYPYSVVQYSLLFTV